MNKIRWAALGVFLVGIFGGVSNVFADSTLLTVNISHVSLELDVPSSPVVLNLNPTFSGSSFGSVDLTATVGTNNPSGYHLSVDFSDTALSHIGEVSGTTPTINTLETLAGGYTEDAFTVNRWGHKITGNNYFPIPSSTLSPESWTSDGPVNNAGNTMTLAAKVDASSPSGAYEVTLNYTLVANIVEITFDDAYAAAGKSKDVTSDKYYLHEMVPSICSAVTTGQTGQLVDIRDGTVYRVGKLADERCWLLDNLALDLTATGASTNITSTNTNADATSLNALFNGGRVSGDYSTDNLATAGVADWTSGYSYSAPIINKTSKDLVNSSDEIEAIRTSKYGIYYNYCAASAGSYCYGNGTSIDTSYDRPDTLIDAEYDICPAGWRMPTSTDSGEYQALWAAYPTVEDAHQINRFRTALLAPLSGYNYDSGVSSQGVYGSFWSATRHLNDYMRSLFVRNGVDPSSLGYRPNGYSVRCIARDGNEPDPNATPVDPIPGANTFDDAYAAAGRSKDATSDKYQLHEMTPAICSTVTTGVTGQLVDIRDGTVYRVGKLADEHCWLLDNLALDLTATGASANITSANTNADATSLNALFNGGRVSGDTSTNGLATTSVANWKYGYSYSAPLMNKEFKGKAFYADPIGAIRKAEYGIYYNYCAASAGSYCYGNGTEAGTIGDRPDALINDAKYDICPAGWRLPTGGSAGEYEILYKVSYHSNITDFRTALLAPLSGSWNHDSGRPAGQESHGSLWSSTASSVYGFYYITYDADKASTVYYYRYYGESVRCIAK